MLASRRLDPAARHSFDRRFAEIDKTHIRLIEDIKKSLCEGRPLGAIGMKWLRWCEHLGYGRVLDARPRFVAPEIVGGTVRLFVEKQIVEPTTPRRQAADLPDTFERRSPLVLGHLGCGLFEGVIVEPSEARPAFLIGAWIVLLHATDRIVVKFPLSHR